MEPPTCGCGLIAIGKCTQCGKWVCKNHASEVEETVYCMDCHTAEWQRRKTEFELFAKTYGALEAVYAYRKRYGYAPYEIWRVISEYLKPNCAFLWLAFAQRHSVPAELRLGYCVYPLAGSNIRFPSHLEPASEFDDNGERYYTMYCSTAAQLIYFPREGRNYSNYRELTPLLLMPNQINWQSVGVCIENLIERLP